MGRPASIPSLGTESPEISSTPADFLTACCRQAGAGDHDDGLAGLEEVGELGQGRLDASDAAAVAACAHATHVSPRRRLDRSVANSKRSRNLHRDQNFVGILVSRVRTAALLWLPRDKHAREMLLQRVKLSCFPSTGKVLCLMRWSLLSLGVWSGRTRTNKRGRTDSNFYGGGRRDSGPPRHSRAGGQWVFCCN